MSRAAARVGIRRHYFPVVSLGPLYPISTFTGDGSLTSDQSAVTVFTNAPTVWSQSGGYAQTNGSGNTNHRLAFDMNTKDIDIELGIYLSSYDDRFELYFLGTGITSSSSSNNINMQFGGRLGAPIFSGGDPGDPSSTNDASHITLGLNKVRITRHTGKGTKISVNGVVVYDNSANVVPDSTYGGTNCRILSENGVAGIPKIDYIASYIPLTSPLPFSDNFNRTGAVGNGWLGRDTGSDSTETCDGAAVGTPGVTSGRQAIVHNLGSPLVDISATFTGTAPAAMDLGVVLGTADTDWLQLYSGDSGNAGIYTIHRRSGALSTSLLQSCGQFTPGTLRMVNTGTVVIAYNNGTEVARHTLAAGEAPVGNYSGPGLYNQGVTQFDAVNVPSFLDNFHRADGDAGYVSRTGGGETLTIVSNRATASSATGHGYGTVDSGLASLGTVEATFDTATNGNALLLARTDSANPGTGNSLQVNCNQSASALYSIVNGAATVLINFGPYTQNATGQKLKLIFTGTTVELFLNNVSVGTATVPVELRTGTRVGCGTDGAVFFTQLTATP